MNEDRKAQFLSDRNRDPKNLSYVFRKLAPYEEQRNEDVCMFPAEVLQKILNENFGVSTQNTNSTLSMLKVYNKWCQENGYETNDGIFDVVIDTVDKVRKRMVSSPKHLAMRLDELFSPVSDESIHCIYRSYFWLIYMGMDYKEALEVKTAEVDLNNLIVTHDGRVYEIYREAIPAFRITYDANFLNYHTKKGTYYRKARGAGEYFLRGFRGTKPDVEAFRSQVQKAMPKSPARLRATNVYFSGLFYRAYEMERCGIKPDLFIGKLKDGGSVAAKWNTERDYEAWKQAFG